MCTINPSPGSCHVIAFFNEVDVNFVDRDADNSCARILTHQIRGCLREGLSKRPAGSTIWGVVIVMTPRGFFRMLIRRITRRPLYIRVQHEPADNRGHRVTPLYGALLPEDTQKALSYLPDSAVIFINSQFPTRRF